MKVKDRMCNNIYYCLPNSTVTDCAKLMNEKHVGCIPVCDEGKNLVGLVTDRDITLRCIASNKDCNTTKVSDIMTCNVYSCTLDDDIKNVENKMAENKIRRIPIVDNNKVIGMITLGDLAKNKEINSEGVCATLEDICCTNKNKNAE